MKKRIENIFNKSDMPKGLIAILLFIPFSWLLMANNFFSIQKFYLFGNIFDGTIARIFIAIDALWLVLLFSSLITLKPYSYYLLHVQAFGPLLNDAVNYLSFNYGFLFNIVNIIWIIQSVALLIYLWFLKDYFERKRISKKADLGFSSFYSVSYLSFFVIFLYMFWLGGTK